MWTRVFMVILFLKWRNELGKFLLSTGSVDPCVVRNYIPVFKKKDAGRRKPKSVSSLWKTAVHPLWGRGNPELGHSLAPWAAWHNRSLHSCQQVCTEVIHAEVGLWPGSNSYVTEKNNPKWCLNHKPEDLRWLTLDHQLYLPADSATVLSLFLSLQSN